MKKMPEFTIGGTPRLQKAFVDVLGVQHYGGPFDKSWNYLYGDHSVSSINQRQQKRGVHFDLPQDWDIAMDYARDFYGIKKENDFLFKEQKQFLSAFYAWAERNNIAWLTSEQRSEAVDRFLDEKEKEKPNPMTEQSFWQDKQLEAIHPCLYSLTVGKLYDPIVFDDRFYVIDDGGHKHHFRWGETMEKFFKVVDKPKLTTLEKTILEELLNWDLECSEESGIKYALAKSLSKAIKKRCTVLGLVRDGLK